MNKEFLPYQQSLELQKLGFNEPCFGAHASWGFMSANDVNSLSDEVTQKDLDDQGYNEEDAVCLAPTWRQAFRFFRDKYKLYGSYGQTNDDREEVNGFVISNFINGTRNKLFADWEVGTYEEAELACLVKLISIVKEQQNGK